MLMLVHVLLVAAGIGFAVSLAGLMATGRKHKRDGGSLAAHKRWFIYVMLAVVSAGFGAAAFVALNGFGQPSVALYLHRGLFTSFTVLAILTTVFNGRRYPTAHPWIAYPCGAVGEALAVTGIWLALP